MTVSSLITGPFEPAGGQGARTAIVLTTRVRLARNLAGHSFPGWANAAERAAILDTCRDAVGAAAPMKGGLNAAVSDLTDLEKQVLVERHLISRELSANPQGSGVIISRDQAASVMVNEEDHLRIQVLRAGLQLKKAWNLIDELDSALEDHLDFAFSPTLGYLTACPTNLGTGMRGSAMMHLPALVIAGQMEAVVRAVGQLGMAVRGLFGEGSDASGSIFQISNQTTLGESEGDIIKRLESVLESIVDHELNARGKLLETDSTKLFDKIGRAYGILRNGHLLTSGEAMNLLSLIRLGVDLKIFPDPASRSVVDRLFIEAQPGHLQYALKSPCEPGERDALRAAKLRSEFANLAAPDFNHTS